jgi:hypothetical protein
MGVSNGKAENGRAGFLSTKERIKTSSQSPKHRSGCMNANNNLKGKDKIGLNILLPLKTRRVENVWRKKPRHNHDPTTDSQQNKG